MDVCTTVIVRMAVDVPVPIVNVSVAVLLVTIVDRVLVSTLVLLAVGEEIVRVSLIVVVAMAVVVAGSEPVARHIRYPASRSRQVSEPAALSASEVESWIPYWAATALQVSSGLWSAWHQAADILEDMLTEDDCIGRHAARTWFRSGRRPICRSWTRGYHRIRRVRKLTSKPWSMGNGVCDDRGS